MLAFCTSVNSAANFSAFAEYTRVLIFFFPSVQRTKQHRRAFSSSFVNFGAFLFGRFKHRDDFIVVHTEPFSRLRWYIFVISVRNWSLSRRTILSSLVSIYAR